MSEVLNLRHILADSALPYYVTNETIMACEADPDVGIAAHILVSERHGKFDLSQMTAYLLTEKRALTARVAELEAALVEAIEHASGYAKEVHYYAGVRRYEEDEVLTNLRMLLTKEE